MSVTLVHAAIKYDSEGHICEHCLHILFDEMLYLDIKYVLSVIQFVTFSHTTSFVALQGIAAYVLPSWHCEQLEHDVELPSVVYDPRGHCRQDVEFFSIK